jgi:arsenate reductase
MSFSTRDALLTDAAVIARIYNQGVEDRCASFATDPISAERVTGWLASAFPAVVVDDGGEVVAFALSTAWRSAEWFRGVAELSVYTAREGRGKGAGRAALHALIVAAKTAGLRKLFAGVFSDNRASRALFATAGFREVGVQERQGQLDGAWKDVVVLEKLLTARVIFACVHNAGRSQMAAAFFNGAADPRLAVAISAGTQPAERVHPEVIEVMREAGIDLARAVPQKLTAELARGASMLVTMGCGDECPVVPGVVRDDWPLPDPKGKSLDDVRRVRDEIRLRVENQLRVNGWA